MELAAEAECRAAAAMAAAEGLPFQRDVLLRAHAGRLARRLPAESMSTMQVPNVPPSPTPPMTRTLVVSLTARLPSGYYPRTTMLRATPRPAAHQARS
jgi:hypothetical protein